MKNFLYLIVVVTFFAIGYGHPLCSDTTTSVIVPNLQFCTQYIQNGSCCNYNSNLGGKTYKDVTVQSNFTSMGLDINSNCGALMQKIMCTKCDPWSAHLRGDISNERAVPFLCPDFCSSVYASCKDVAMTVNYSPFGYNKISDKWTTQQDFCGAFAATSGYCFDGNPYVDPAPADFNSNQGLCLDRVIAQPNGSPYITATSVDQKVVIATREGIVSSWQVTARGPFPNLGVFLNITSRVWQNGEGGLLGMAYHPADKTRFFVSYICDPSTWDDCRWDRRCTTNADCLYAAQCMPSGRCGCYNTSHCTDGGICNVNTAMCNSAAGPSNHVQMTVIAEYAVDPANANRAIQTEKKRVLVASRQGANHNGGQILFGPDQMLYIFMGDGGGNGARGPQSSNSFMGKVLRIDVSQTTPGYAVPASNPWVGNSSYRPEIWAEGMRNPWRNSWDFTTNTLWNGDVGDATIEEINQILPGKNYGWRKFEGSIQWNPDTIDPKPTKALNTPPKMSYTHDSMKPNNGACVIGGYWYRGTKNTCWQNKYIFSDQLGAFFAGAEDGAGSGLYSSNRIGWACGSDKQSTLNCATSQIRSIYSLADDTQKNLYFLTDQGVMQLVEANRCPAIDCNAVPVTTSASSSAPAVSTAASSATSAATPGATSATSAASSASTSNMATTVATSGSVSAEGDFDLICSNSPALPYTGGIVTLHCYPCVEGGYDRINLPPNDESLVWKMDEITGTYNGNLNGGLGFVSLSVDAGNFAQQTVQARIRYDFDGNGVWDRVEVFDKWPTNDLSGWETYSLTQSRFFDPYTSGDFKPFTSGSIDLTIWQSSGSHYTNVTFGGTWDNHNSFIQIPYNLGNNCGYQVLGKAVGFAFTSQSTAPPTTATSAASSAATSDATSAASSAATSADTSAASSAATSNADSTVTSNAATKPSASFYTTETGKATTGLLPTSAIGNTATSSVNMVNNATSAGRFTRSSASQDDVELSVSPVLFHLAMVLFMAVFI